MKLSAQDRGTVPADLRHRHGFAAGDGAPRTRVALAATAGTGLVVVAVLLGAGLAGGAPNPGPVLEAPGYHPLQYSRTAIDTTPTRASNAEIVATVLGQRPSGSAVLDVRLTDDPAAGGSGRALQVDLSTSAWSGTGPIRASWEGSLVQGAIAEQLAGGEDTSTGLAGATFRVHLPDGTVRTIDAGAGQVRKGQVFSHLDPAGQEAARVEVQKALRSFGLEPVSISFFTYQDDAVEIVCEVPAGGELRDFELLRQTLTGSPASYEGVYLEVRDSDGSPIAASATAFRTGAGSQWVDPEFGSSVGEVGRGTVHG